MNPPLTDIVWKSRGISVLWDVNALASLGPLSDALSLREFFLWDADGWGEQSVHACFTGGKRCIVVAGLEAALDAMEPDDADAWMSEHLLPAVSRCGDVVFSGGQHSLIFWMVRRERFKERLWDGAILWSCDGGHRGREILFSHGMWNGAYKDVQRIVPPGSDAETGIGFYLQRIS